MSEISTKGATTRRRFFWKAGAALSAPLAVAASDASARGEDADALRARLAELEDLNAIRELQQAYAQHVNSHVRDSLAALFADPANSQLDGSVRGVAAEPFAHGAIELAADRATARARIDCTVDVETAIEPRCTLVEMARQQGGGVIRRSEKRVLENAYVKQDGVWKIERSVWHFEDQRVMVPRQRAAPTRRR
jgi:hypothetical protein